MTSPLQRAWDAERCASQRVYKAHWTRRRAERHLYAKTAETAKTAYAARAIREAYDRLYDIEMDADAAHDLAKERLDTMWHTYSERLPPYQMLTDADACVREISTGAANALVGCLVRDGLISDPNEYYRRGLVDVHKLVSLVLQKAQSNSVRVGADE